jgi:hypothetical protein
MNQTRSRLDRPSAVRRRRRGLTHLGAERESTYRDAERDAVAGLAMRPRHSNSRIKSRIRPSMRVGEEWRETERIACCIASARQVARRVTPAGILHCALGKQMMAPCQPGRATLRFV